MTAMTQPQNAINLLYRLGFRVSCFGFRATNLPCICIQVGLPGVYDLIAWLLMVCMACLLG